LHAQQVSSATRVRLIDGTVTIAEAGDWLIYQGEHVLDRVPDATFDRHYSREETEGLRLSTATCQALEETLGLGATAAPDRLIKAVQRLAKITIGRIAISFTPGQLEELKRRADKRGHTPERELKDVVERIKQEIFWGGTPR
jgi:hypothetical protein